MRDERIIADALELLDAWGVSSSANSGLCLYQSFAVVRAAAKRGRRLIAQAGTCYWPRLTEEQDDGIDDFQFGYMWTPIDDDEVIRRVGEIVNARTVREACGFITSPLPEIHVWAGDPETQEVIDLSAGDFPTQCEKILKKPWRAPKPPAVFWGKSRDLPKGAHYKPHLSAVMFVHALWHIVGKK